MKNAPDLLRGMLAACYNGSGKGAFCVQRRCWPVLLVLWPYAGLILTWMQVQYDEFSIVPWQIWMAGMVALCLVNIVCALRRKEHAALISVTVKLLLIPYYVISFFLGFILFIAAPPAIIIVLLLNGLLLLATSSYTLRSVYLDWRAEKLSTAWTIVLAVSQIIFVLDVPGSIALYLYEKRRSR